MNQARKEEAVNAPEVLRVSGITKSFGEHLVLRGIDFAIRRGERVCILGPSGSGKTTFLRCLNLLAVPDTGALDFDGERRFAWGDGRPGASKSATRSHRKQVSMVFQQFELFPHLTARANVALGPRKVLGAAKEEALVRADEMLARVHLAEYATRYPAQLSGGQQQRVAIARSLAMKPELILFDEPTSALDPEMAHEVVDIMAELAEAGTTMVVVTHDAQIAREIADRVIVMDGGEILEQGTTQQVLDRPTQPRTAEILRIREAPAA